MSEQDALVGSSSTSAAPDRDITNSRSPGTDPTHTAAATVDIDVTEAHHAVTTVLMGLGASQDEAEAQATQLVESELRGRPSHGLQRLPVIAARVNKGLIAVGTAATMDWQGDALLRVDGGGGFGPYVANAAIDAMLARTKLTGVAVAAVRNCSHLGMLAPYLERAVSADTIALAMTTSEAVVHPAGGATALLGTNPIGVGIPTGDDHPFILDMSTAAISVGEIQSHALRAKALPPGRAVDRNGNPTTDPSSALEGAISPFGGAKGYALGLAIELLVAALTQTALGTRVRGTLDTEHPVTKGDVFAVIDQRRTDRSADLIRDYLAEIRGSTPAAGSSGVTIPGDRMAAERSRRLREGITVPASVWTQVLDLQSGSES